MGGAGGKQLADKHSQSHKHKEVDKETPEPKSTNIVKSNQKRRATSAHRRLSVSSCEVPESDTVLPIAVTSIGYELHRKIGEGSFANVYLATNTALPGVQLACKVFCLHSLSLYWRRKYLKQEMKIMLKLRHKNICYAYDAIKTPTKAYIFMRYAANGSLERWVKGRNGSRMEEAPCRGCFTSLMLGLEYLHQHNVAHRDLKLENFLLDESLQPMITDFGLSIIRYDTAAEGPLLCQSVCGTALYAAPEVRALTPNGWYSTHYDAKKADIYSMGVCLFELLHGERPFEGDYDLLSKELTSRQLKADYRINPLLRLSKDCRALITALLEPAVSRRPTASAVLASAWLSRIVPVPATVQQQHQQHQQTVAKQH